MRLLRTTATIFAMILATSCAKSRDIEQQRTQLRPGTTSTIETVKPREFVQTLSLATFDKDQLEACTDVTTRQFPPDGAPPDWTPKFADFDAGKGQLKLSKPCAEQFADRLVIATCAFEKDDSKTPDKADIQATIRYYNINTLDIDDAEMHDCLEMHGDWKALSRESPEYKRERMRSHARMLHKSIEQQ